MSNENNSTIADESVVTIHYTLSLDDGETVDSSRDDGREPMSYLHGAQNIVPGLESQITGKAVGDKLDVVVSAEEGYGPRIEGATQVVPRTELPSDLEVAPGMPINAEGADGTHLTLFVTDVTDENITVDMNHPLAGEDLHFEVEIMDVREASEEEKEHGHPHGPGGHGH